MPTVEELAGVIEAAIGPLPAPLRAALVAVDRTRYVRAVDRSLAFENLALPLDTPASAAAPPVANMIQSHGSWLQAAIRPEYTASGSTISQPLMYMLAFKLLELTSGDRFLELGTGTGYGAALAAQVVGATGQVTSIDVDSTLTDRARALTTGANVTLLCDDALSRADLLAAHSACWITFSIPEVPSAMLDALKDGARLLAPVGPPPPTPQRYLLYKREQGQLVRQELDFPVFFIPDRKPRSNSPSN